MMSTRKDGATEVELLSRTAALGIGAVAYTRSCTALDEGDYRAALDSLLAARIGLNVIERQAVRFARREGASWADVARALGVTRQAAQQRFAAQM